LVGKPGGPNHFEDLSVMWGWYVKLVLKK
jgi:hypothetical protein